MIPKFKVFMFSWEFPPRIIGGISAHVHDLSLTLSELEVDVTVITCDFPHGKGYEETNGIHIHRVDSYRFPSQHFASWVSMMNLSIQQYAAELVKQQLKRGPLIILHCHDWLMANAAISLKHLFRMPLLVTIHSTEHGRRNGIHNDYQRMIHQTESWLVHEAWRVICCSKYMASQVSHLFNISRDNIDVIPNGVNAEQYRQRFSRAFRKRFAEHNERLVLFVGRLVSEKGVSILLDSVKCVLQSVNAKFVIVGDGYMRDRLVDQAQHLGISHKVYFTGFLDDKTVKRLYRVADLCAVPSLYEPFGIVALEAMASQTPVVVSRTGGLVEIVEHDKTGVIVYPNDPESLAWGILRILLDANYAKRLTRNAYREIVNRFDWTSITEKTKEVYERIFNEYANNSWKP